MRDNLYPSPAAAPISAYGRWAPAPVHVLLKIVEIGTNKKRANSTPWVVWAAPAPLLCIQTNFAVGVGGCIGPNGCAVLYRTSSNPKRATRNRICITTHRPPFLFERAIAWTSDSKEAFNQAGEKSHGKELAGYTAAKAVSIDSKLVLVTTR